jgi:hypothetical protein
LFQTVIENLIGKAESDTTMEDEVLELIGRMVHTDGAARAVTTALRSRLMKFITEHFTKLCEGGRRISSDSHELGGLIMLSRDYLEYYCDEELKAALLRYFKGVSTNSASDLLKRLKATAVRVEVHHFDGYTALADLRSYQESAKDRDGTGDARAGGGKTRQGVAFLAAHPCSPPGNRRPDSGPRRGSRSPPEVHLYMGPRREAVSACGGRPLGTC